ncbi:conserved Plasmodium protein, unknown function [Plasmodium chabaudi chabaudi]|uniref:Uncharacterized protein n=1 Tax=Plasmodium chabaudi chabaudi TaxID=31271 RepID=A0A4V0K5B6_PLACU|nr:conserved Plasmodium protein, unknown function [Plasmodium chabaudi chabaudi]VTZ67766.1 conserved Plasmodium protein, unknown function [Plasmodium chabaudi chabaudi]|eukprot:XP_016653455.1 conserved Plasmodium protein, unknown function [Plasmodium chabaudi chabaudi]
MENNAFNEIIGGVRVISSTDTDNAKEIVNNGNNNKNSKLKKIINGIISNKMKHAKNVFEEVKEHIKYTAKEAQKNMNYPFCKSPCNIENLKNTIYINDEEIVINKNIYKNIFTNKRKESNESEEEEDEEKDEGVVGKKKNNQNLFVCEKSDIIIKGKYNFGFTIDVISENEENKIIAYAYEKDTNKKLPCIYKWRRIYYDKEYGLIEHNLNNTGSKNMQGKVTSGNGKGCYGSEYELTSDDIGFKISVECTCINNERMDNGSITPENYKDTNFDEYEKAENNNNINMNNNKNSFYNDASSFKSTFKGTAKESYTSQYEKLNNKKSYNNIQNSEKRNLENISNYSKNSSNTSINSYYKNMKNKKKNSIESDDENRLKKSTKRGLLKSDDEFSLFSNTKNEKNKTFETQNHDIKNNKYYGVAIAEIGPFNLNTKTKNMLETIIYNDSIKYPIYILNKDDKKYNSLQNENKYYDQKTLENIMFNESKTNNSFSTYNDYNYVDNQSVYSNLEGENEYIYMLHIYKNEIKIINQNNKMKNMWNYKFHHIYPYVEFINIDRKTEKHNKNDENNNHFLLHVNENESYKCKCLFKRHRDLISILLKYMHANLYIINEYIFNNINQNFEKTRVKNIFNNVDVNSILENLNKELLLNRKINQKYLSKIHNLQNEKNALEDDLKNTIEAFQLQLDNAKKFKDPNELIKENEKLMKEIKILQDKYKNVDLFFKDKYKLLLNDIEKYKKLVQENMSKTNSKEDQKLQEKIQFIEKEKINLLNENKKIHNLYLEEKRNKTDLENKVENLSLKLEHLNKSLQEEKQKSQETYESLKELKEVKKNNNSLERENIKISNELNLLTSEKNRLTKLVDSLTKDIEKSKKNDASKKDDTKTESKQNDKLLKELISLRDENELLKKRIKKFANFSSTVS